MLSRRHLLKTMVVTAGSVSAAGLLSACHDRARKGGPVDTAAAFPQSVASGDPRPGSVVLWTRVGDESRVDSDFRVGLEVSTDSAFTELVVGEYFVAQAAHDHCLKVRVTGLNPNTTYYYRFTYRNISSNTGRTRTAPAVSDDVNVRYAFLSCQDYIGRYYNTYLMLLEQDPDFVVFLGDYIYETTGDNQFQGNAGDRNIEFEDTDGVLRVGPADNFYFAAGSLDNYRQLYRVYRQDPLLQRVHEQYAFINTWDDHEYSDDCWGENASYYDGAINETSRTRRHIAEQAFFEFTPIDHESVGDAQVSAEGALSPGDAPRYPDTRIYRDFRFGRHLHLFVTDFRTYRPDHLIAEDAFPGVVVMTQGQLEQYFTERAQDFADVAANYTPYVNLDAAENSARKTAMINALTTAYRDAYAARGLDPDTHASRISELVAVASSGNMGATQVNAYVDGSLQFTDEDMATMPRGLAYSTMGKTSLFSDVGARYFVIKPIYDVYADFLAQNDGAPNVLGDEQMVWLESGLRGSTATHKVVASSVSFSPLILDLAEPPLDFISPLYSFVPAGFRQAFYFNVDHWDGFPVQKRALIQGLLGETGAITIAGDVHSSYACEHPLTSTGRRSIDFTGGAVSSGTWGEFTKTAADSLSPALAALVPLLDAALEQSTTRADVTSKVRFASTAEHSINLMTVSADAVRVDFHLVPAEEGAGENKVSVVGTNYYDNAEAYLAKRRLVSFQVMDGELIGAPT